MDTDLLNQLDFLSRLDPVAKFDVMWAVIKPTMSIMSGVSLALCFTLLLIELLSSLVKNDKPYTFNSFAPLLLKTFLIAVFFATPVYQAWTGLFISIMNSFNSALGSGAIVTFQAHFREYLYGLQNASSESVGVSIKLMNPLAFVVSYVNQFVIASYFFIVSIGPVFVIVSILLGPLCGAFSIFFPQVGKNWIAFFLSSIFFSAIVGLALFAIGDSAFLKIAGNFSFVNSQIVELILAFTILVTFTMIPIAISAVFGVHFYSFISSVMGVTFAMMGLAPIGIQMVASSKVIQVIKKVMNKQ